MAGALWHFGLGRVNPGIYTYLTGAGFRDGRLSLALHLFHQTQERQKQGREREKAREREGGITFRMGVPRVVCSTYFLYIPKCQFLHTGTYCRDVGANYSRSWYTVQ